jgi:predicted ABC-type ATPase
LATKELIVVAGPNGAGKSTYAAELVAQQPRPYLSADAIAAEMAPADPTSAQSGAGREFLDRLNVQLAAEVSFLVETTLSGRSFRNFLAAAKAASFATTIVFVYLDSPDTCVARVQERVRKGGHHVPEPDVRRRFSRSFHNFWHVYREIADEWFVVYNFGSEFKRIASGQFDAITVHDQVIFDQFLQLVGIDSDDTVNG